MTPAQGNARIEITPQNKDLFGDKRVFIDWRHMTVFKTEDGQPATKEGYINSLPRIFPELLPRICSSTRMQKVRPVLLRIREAITTGQKRSVVNQYFAEARELLREKDQSMYPRDATAFDSEGMCYGSFDIQAFMDVAWPHFLKYEPDEFVRAIAYTHVDHQPFQDFVAKNLQARDVNVGVIIAAGKCLRSQPHIALFTKSFLNQLHSGQAKMDWWKALSEILRFRGDATQPMTSSDCIEIIKGAGQVFHRERVRGTAKQLFRTACIVIVYILRRRAFDDTFLPPESDLAIWIKSEFRQARSDSKAGKLRLMGGSVDLSSQLQLIIDYVDRQGKGQLLIGD
jgi:hypothetical protein